MKQNHKKGPIKLEQKTLLFLIALQFCLFNSVSQKEALAQTNASMLRQNHYCVRRERGLTGPPATSCPPPGWRRMGVGVNGCGPNEVSYLCRSSGFEGSDMVFRRPSERGSAVRRDLSGSSVLTAVMCRNPSETNWRNFRTTRGTPPSQCRRLRRDASCRSNQVAWSCSYPVSAPR
jgi:hypothetical protein